jgi:hypothetical protein
MTDFRNSQTALETWSTDLTSVRVSQAVLEAWINVNVMPTFLFTSQDVLEAWSTNTPINLVVSQVLAEAWLGVQAASGGRYRVMSQAV